MKVVVVLKAVLKSVVDSELVCGSVPESGLEQQGPELGLGLQRRLGQVGLGLLGLRLRKLGLRQLVQLGLRQLGLELELKLVLGLKQGWELKLRSEWGQELGLTLR